MSNRLCIEVSNQYSAHLRTIAAHNGVSATAYANDLIEKGLAAEKREAEAAQAEETTAAATALAPHMPDTINVVEINGDDGRVSSLRSFYDDPQGKVDAEELFRQLCRETTDLKDGQIAEAVEQGFAEVPGNASVQLVKSNNWSD